MKDLKGESGFVTLTNLSSLIIVQITQNKISLIFRNLCRSLKFHNSIKCYLKQIDGKFLIKCRLDAPKKCLKQLGIKYDFFCIRLTVLYFNNYFFDTVLPKSFFS